MTVMEFADMMAQTTSNEARMDEHTRQLGEAIRTLLEELEKHEGRRASDPLRQLTNAAKPVWAHEINVERMETAPWVDDAVGQALRHGIRRIGELLAKRLTLAEMLEVAKFATGERYDTRIDVIDKRWSGLSDKNGVVWMA